MVFEFLVRFWCMDSIELILLFSKLEVPQDSSKFLMSFATVGEISVGPGGPLTHCNFNYAKNSPESGKKPNFEKFNFGSEINSNRASKPSTILGVSSTIQK